MSSAARDVEHSYQLRGVAWHVACCMLLDRPARLPTNYLSFPLKRSYTLLGIGKVYDVLNLS